MEISEEEFNYIVSSLFIFMISSSLSLFIVFTFKSIFIHRFLLLDLEVLVLL